MGTFSSRVADFGSPPNFVIHRCHPTRTTMAFNLDSVKGRRNWAIATLGSIGAIYLPNIRSTHSLVAKHVTEAKWAKLGGLKTPTTGFTLGQAIACAVEFDDQHCGIYAGDKDSYDMFKDVFDPIIGVPRPAQGLQPHI